VSEGLRIALIGFFKKIVIANQLAPYITNAYSDLNSTTGASLWIIFLITPLYLYFDFSGYTNIAIGFARTLGINLLPNFNSPFFAQNVTTFWRRFHISLSSWFNDYIFRQLSFKYRSWGTYASSISVFVTWILFGIWHGAGWNFMILGILQALIINYEFLTKAWRVKLFSGMPNINRWLGRVLTYLFYCLSLVFFFSHDLKSVFAYFSKLTHSNGSLLLDDLSLTPFMLVIYIPVFLLMELIRNDYSNTFNKLSNFWLCTTRTNRYIRWTVYSIMIAVLFVAGGKAQQFVYVNF
jgi:D-alanyl-lipoteichoic acid acyltransferase DltB (MBOAT superfamily)